MAVEPAEKIGRGLLVLLRIALGAARDEVAVGVATGVDARNDVVEAHDETVEALSTVETQAALASVDGAAAFGVVEEIRLLDEEALADGLGGGRCEPGIFGQMRADGADFVGEANFDQMADIGALDQAQDVVRDEATDGVTHGLTGNADAAGEFENGEAKLALAFEAAMTEEMRIDGAVDGRKAQARNEMIRELVLGAGGVWF